MIKKHSIIIVHRLKYNNIRKFYEYVCLIHYIFIYHITDGLKSLVHIKHSFLIYIPTLNLQTRNHLGVSRIENSFILSYVSY